MKVRKKPVEVEAELWDGRLETIKKINEFIKVDNWGLDGEYLTIPTLEGMHYASPGDYIIKGVHGEFYPCKPDIFNKTYDILN
jgi:hypothetical protein